MSRPRLLDALDHAVSTSALTLVAAGPGGGKTVLLSEWARRRQAPTAWMALTRADDDPRRFWALFVKAAQSTSGQSFPTAWAPGAVPGLLDSLFSEEQPDTAPVVIVLDDAHVLTNPDVVDGLDRVVRRWSERVSLVLSTRSVPLLPMHQYRLADQLHEIRAADLAMTVSEAGELLRAHGVMLPERETTVLTERTEGWTAGLRLAALRMEGADRPADVVRQLAMGTGSIGEYLIEEVLSVLPAHVRQLLVQTSFLDEVTGGAASAVTGIAGCEEILAGLARTNSFVIPLDAELTVFRYHQLFREVLRYLARRQSGVVTAEAHRRATEWFRSQHDVRGALLSALRGGDVGLARSVLVRGGLAQSFAWGQDLDAVRLDDVLTAPATPEPGELEEIATARMAVAALRAGRSPRDRPATAWPASQPVPLDSDLRVTRHVAEVLLAQASGDHVAVGRAVTRLLGEDLRREVASVRGLRSRLLLVQANTRFTAGLLTEVEPALELAMAEAQREEAFAVQLDILALQALANASGGRPRRSDAALTQATELLLRHPELHAPVLLDLAMARRAYVEGDLAAMRRIMHRAVAAGPIHTDPDVAASVAYVQAILLAASGDLAQAQAWLDAPALATADAGMLVVYRDCERASIETALGRPAQALSVLSPYEGGPYAITTSVPAALARLALGDVDGAEAQVRPVLTEPSPQIDRYLVVSALLCQAQVALQRDDDARALEYVDRAFAVAERDVIMPFLRVASTFAPLLARHPEAVGRWPSRLPTLPETDAVPHPRPAPGRRDSALEPLTEREQAVLRLLTTTMSTTELADELVLSVNTVKTHLAAIYRKMGVGRRREAVQRARELELL